VTPAPDGVRVAIRLSPRAKADRLNGVAVGVGGRRMVAAMVSAAPEDGRANMALLQLLAQAWRLPRRDLSLVGGAASRHKTVHIAGDPQQLVERLAALLSAAPGR
jgi:uncharacterized protein